MKRIKSISLFLAYSISILYFGFISGKVLNGFPEKEIKREIQNMEATPGLIGATGEETEKEETTEQRKSFAVSYNMEEVLGADTEYVIEEYDIKDGTKVEQVKRVPAKYMGMNREEFLEAMEIYERYPPLSELERGFTSLEVTGFSARRVVVRMNYSYVEPTKGFYICIMDHKVKVYCDDRKTVYLDTDMRAEDFPEYLQLEMLHGMYMGTEEELYHFLETYSS
ncbi:MAG: hypothetical protein ACI4EX_07640 [Lachnospiraceae bacterium]